MCFTVIKFREKSESIHRQGIPVLGWFHGKSRVCPKLVFHPLIYLAPPAFEPVRTDHKINQSEAHIPALSERPGVGSLDFPDPVHLHFNGPCGADIFTGPTGDTPIGINLKRRSNLFPGSSVRKPNGMGPHDLIAGSHTEAAKEAIVFRVFSFEWALLNAQFPG
jgi:hypothetical protein